MLWWDDSPAKNWGKKNNSATDLPAASKIAKNVKNAS